MRTRQRGAALILVLAAVSILSVLAVELASRASSDALRATSGSRGRTFRRLFDSASEVGRGLVTEHPSEMPTHLEQKWNREMSIRLADTESVAFRLQDESGKVNVTRHFGRPDATATLERQLRRLFGYLSRHSNQDAPSWHGLGNKVIARIQSGSTLSTLDELRQDGIQFIEIFGPEGLSTYLTCFGDGKVNINTASKAVLYSIDAECDEALVDKIIAHRSKTATRTAGYFRHESDVMLVDGIVNRSVGKNGELRASRTLFEKIGQRITVRSSCFSLKMHARADVFQRQAWAFFEPSGVKLALAEVCS